MADYGTEQNLRLAQQMLKQQGEINALRAERDALKAAIETSEVARFAVDVHRLVGDYSNEERGVIALTPFEATLDQLCLEKYGFDLDKVAALPAPETTPDAPTACRRREGSMVEPGTETEGDWDSAAMRHHPYTGEPCTACNGTGKATGWLDRLAASSLAAAREKFGPENLPETTPDAPTGGED